MNANRGPIEFNNDTNIGAERLDRPADVCARHQHMRDGRVPAFDMVGGSRTLLIANASTIEPMALGADPMCAKRGASICGPAARAK
jgi:hypothetical protein